MMSDPDAVTSLADRLRLIRVELYGDSGTPRLAGCLGIPLKTWTNCESGVTTSAMIILRLIEITRVNPLWLLDGREPKRLPRCPGPSPFQETVDELEPLGVF
jgi:hypothetical protein